MRKQIWFGKKQNESLLVEQTLLNLKLINFKALKKSTLLTFYWMLLFFPMIALAQVGGKQPDAFIRCGTMEAIQKQIDTDPAYRAIYEKGLRDYEESKNYSGSLARTSALTGPVIIPVIVHIVLPNPYRVTDADVDYFINRLNLDFSGLNPDSTNAVAFYPVRGRSLLRFTRARRDPNGNFTTGIERRVGAGVIGMGEPQAIKSAATGGINSWDHTRYYNMWVGVGAGGLLGIAPAIGVGSATSDGVCVDFSAFANNPCYSIPQFNLARTAVHEIGHNFGLFHTFQGGCTVPTDFGQLTSPGCPLPLSLLAGADDTPGQSGPTSGCPNGVQAPGCPTSPNPPGKNYQNYMDYTDDACYSMFTKGQVERMHHVLEICRPGYLTTQGHLPPAGLPALDAAPIEAVNPGGVEVVGCVSTTFSNLTCPGTIAPKVRIVNRGTATITSLVVGFRLNNNAVVENTITVNIPTGNATVATFPSVAISAGNNVLKFWTRSPNGLADQVPANDTLTLNLSVGVGVTLPFTEDFSTPTFPPPGWSLVKIAGASTTAAWTRNIATSTGTPGSARANFWNIATGNKFDLRSPLISNVNNDSMFVSFDVAHRQYNAVQDSLQIWVSADCGTTFLKVWEQASTQLSTTTPPSSATQLTAPTPDQWRKITVSLPTAGSPNILSNPNLLFAWRAASNFGNNVFIDNINILGKVALSRDLQPVNFTAPALRLCDGNNVKPTLVVKNNGSTTITAFNVNYQINGGTTTVVNWTGSLRKDSVTRVDLNTANFTPNTYNIKAWTSSPNGLTDQLTTNDTINYTFIVEVITPAPLVEGFEGATFPPALWSITQQPTDDTTWRRTTIAGRNSLGSAFINNFNYRSRGRVDNLWTPVIRYANADSVFLKFDVASTSRSYPGSTATPLDTLEVLMSTDCGVSFRSVYKKWGNELQTIGDPNSPYTDEFTPKSTADWRRDSVNVTRLLGSSNTVRFVFRSTNNNGNNIFLDNVNFTPKVLSAKLKANGFMITPNPFTRDFTIQHYLAPTNLMGFGVYNSVGQQVLSRSFGEGTADSYINVNMAHLSSGVYTIKLMYSNRTISQKIVKVN